MKIGMTKVIASLMLSTALLPVVVSKADSATSGTKTPTTKASQTDATNDKLTSDHQTKYVQASETQVEETVLAVSSTPLKAVQPASEVAKTVAANSAATAPVSATSQAVVTNASTSSEAGSQATSTGSTSQSGTTVASQDSASSQAATATSRTISVKQTSATAASPASATSQSSQATSASSAASQSSQTSASSATSQSSQTSASSATSQSSQASASSATSQSSQANASSATARSAREAVAEPVPAQPNIQANQTIGPGAYDDSVLIKSALFGYQDKFFSEIKAGSISGWHKYGVLPSVTAAQAILESGWGRSQLSTQGNNLFGIKGDYNGQSIWFPTQEWGPNGYYYVNAAFRKYPNWSASVEDHGRFLDENSRYRNLIGERDYHKVANYLQQDGYATDPNYAQSLINMVESYGLQSWDQEVANVQPGQEPLPGNTNNGNNPNTGNNTAGRYVFKAKTDIHAEASMNSAVVGTYDAGEAVNYTAKVDAGGYTWLKYLAYSGKTHYVAISGNGNQNTNNNNNQNNNNQNNNNNGGQTNVIAESGSFKFSAKTNIRNSASKSAKVVGTYNAGESVRYNGKVNAEGLTWLKYVAYSGATHYVAMAGDTIQAPSQPVVVPASGAYRFNYDTAIKTAPQTNAQTVGTYRAGETVYYNGKVSAEGQTWLRYQSYSGAVHYVAMSGNNTNSGSTPVVTPQSGTYRFSGTTAIKSAPDNNSQTVGTYYAGNTVYYNGKVSANGQTWLRYQSYSGASHYVAISGSASNAAPSQTIAQSGAYRFSGTTAIKSAPSASASTVGSYNSGETVYYNGKVIANGQTWLKYQAYSGATHYVAVNDGGASAGTYNVTNSRGAFRFAKATTIRNAPSMSAGVVGRYNQGETVYYNGTVEAEGRTWLKYLSYSGATHYVPR